MIASLNGIVLEKYAPFIVLEVNGVGYELQLPLSDLALLQVGQRCRLYVQQVIREDSQQAFAFLVREQRELFKQLIKISGLGPKLAMALLSALLPRELVNCVVTEDAKRLTRVPGIGPKMAKRLLVELKDKLLAMRLDRLMMVEPLEAVAVESGATEAASSAATPEAVSDRLSENAVQSLDINAGSSQLAITDALSALVNLGYKSQQAQLLIAQIPEVGSKSCEELIKEALKLAAKNG